MSTIRNSTNPKCFPTPFHADRTVRRRFRGSLSSLNSQQCQEVSSGLISRFLRSLLVLLLLFVHGRNILGAVAATTMCYLAGDEEPLIRLKVALKASKGIIGGAVVMIPMVIIAGGLSRDGVAGFMARG